MDNRLLNTGLTLIAATVLALVAFFIAYAHELIPTSGALLILAAATFLGAVATITVDTIRQS